MSRTSKVCYLGVLYIFLVLLASECPAQGLFAVAGKTTWIHGYYGQMGDRGFFGPYNADIVLPGESDYAPLNSWLGIRDVGELATGTNASISQMTFDFSPKVDSGWAQVKGRYKIAAYDAATSPGADVPISQAQWTEWQIGAKPPFGFLFYGKRPLTYALELQFGTSRSDEHLYLQSKPVYVPDILAVLVRMGVLPFAALGIGNFDQWDREVVKFCCKEGSIAATRGKEQEDGSIIFDSKRSLDAQIAWHPGDFLRLPINRGCPDGYLKVKWKEKIGGATVLMDSDSGAVYEFDSPASLTLGFGFFPWHLLRVPIARYPFDTIDTGLTPWNIYDLSASERVNVMGDLTYRTPDLTIGLGTLYSSYHVGPESQGGYDSRRRFMPRVTHISEGWLYAMYNNGRIILNSEVDWYYRTTKFQPSITGAFSGPRYIESLRYMVEAGVQLGPTVTRVMVAHLPGMDRRRGIMMNKQPYVHGEAQSATYAFQPYSTLLGYKYCSGIRSESDLSDATTLAMRVDYSLAANLNTYVSFLKAYRASLSHPWGFIRPNTSGVDGTYGRVQYVRPSDFLDQQLIPPSIPERDLGWELVAGWSWKLLEQLYFMGAIAYWQPGKWFNYACVDKSVPGWRQPPTPGNPFGLPGGPPYGVNPNRTIDPVIAFEVTLHAGF